MPRSGASGKSVDWLLMNTAPIIYLDPVAYILHPGEDTGAIHGLNLIPRKSALARLEYALRPRTKIESEDIKVCMIMSIIDMDCSC